MLQSNIRTRQTPVTVRVERDSRGGWRVGMPEHGKPLRCETPEEARRTAYLSAPREQPCELIVHDAYHRVFEIDRRLGDITRSPARVSTPATVSVITGSRRRSLADSELRQLGRHVRAHGLCGNSRPLALGNQPE
jgi:hypothetical protein